MDIEEYLAELNLEQLIEIDKAFSDALKKQPITKIDHSQYWCIVSMGEEK
tara:strand:+ start:229 stop:378 length:150 start_codon:yes stop_codon:yes gene_type:complete